MPSIWTGKFSYLIVMWNIWIHLACKRNQLTLITEKDKRYIYTSSWIIRVSIILKLGNFQIYGWSEGVSLYVLQNEILGSAIIFRDLFSQNLAWKHSNTTTNDNRKQLIWNKGHNDLFCTVRDGCGGCWEATIYHQLLAAR